MKNILSLLLCLSLTSVFSQGPSNPCKSCFPAQAGHAGQFLKTNGMGFLSWGAAGSGALTDGSGTTANGTAVDLGGTLTSDAGINLSERLFGAFDVSGGLVRRFLVGNNMASAGVCDTCIYADGWNSLKVGKSGSWDFSIDGSSFSLVSDSVTINGNSETGAIVFSMTHNGVTYGITGFEANIGVPEHYLQMSIGDGTTSSSVSVNSSGIEKQVKMSTVNSLTGQSSGLNLSDSYMLFGSNMHNQEYGKDITKGTVLLVDSVGTLVKYQRGVLKFAIDSNGVVTIKDGTQGAGKVLTSDASGNGSWQSFIGTPIKDSIAATGATVSPAINTAHIITSAGAITSATLSFPSGTTGNWIVVVYSKAIATLTNSGVGAGLVSLVAPLLGTSKVYMNVGGNWY